MDPVELTKELIKIDTRNPPGDTSRAVEFLQRLFSSYKTKVYEVGDKKNILIEISKGKKTLMLTSHLDTVPARDIFLNPITVNGKLYGRGSCDAKGCVASICCAVENIEPEFGLKIAFTADEETGGKKGLKSVFEKELADAVIIGEPTGCNSITILQACVLALDIKFNGKDGHTASKNASEGAIFRTSKFIVEMVENFKNLRGNYENYSRIFSNLGIEFIVKTWEAVFNPSIIRGGVKRNIVAPECDISADVRFAPWINVNDVLRFFQRDDMEIKVSGFLPAYGVLVDYVKIEDDLRLLQIIIDAIKSENINPKAIFSLGVGDSRHVRRLGIPAFYLGPGGENLHSEDEFVYISELRLATKIYRNIIEKFRMF
ncbi:MAG: M20/M25/M40 family metallo-hydrolase [Archaeoglobaceae archaeon]|nr:M20/M25/M40 family metallo-hydrolase [Archaeoglobaceae archaeon]MDW8117608.1 M20/M25/M40 family metallo-hydrolase [Archaeoglobaceae archaeon]